MELVLATRNGHKLREFRALLPDHDLLELPEEVTLPPETGETFAHNAAVKARSAAAATGKTAIADDSGIEAVALGGAPGVRSARFAGDGASDQQNLDRLLLEMPSAGDRRVTYVCALAYATPEGEVELFEGRCDGTLAEVPRGDGGFGYDPAFVPAELEGRRTMAELSDEQKHEISHRGRAARELLDWLGKQGKKRKAKRKKKS